MQIYLIKVTKKKNKITFFVKPSLTTSNAADSIILP